jgi:chemotaxis protein methyltransferase CheR
VTGDTKRGAPAGLIAYDTMRLRRLGDTIASELGIKMPAGKLTMLHSRMQRRLHQLGLTSLDAYEDRLRTETERIQLLDLATTNKTDFFREAEHFAYLTSNALPELFRRGDRRTCRVWCAGCSTGEEAYTLAMVLDDYARTHPAFAFEIVATDISVRVLRAAARATYPVELVEPVPQALRQRYLMNGTAELRGQVRVVPELRAKVKFQRLNFMDGHYPLGEVDIIFFRNVLIYFDRSTQKQVLERQCRLLRPGGYLFVGHSESVAALEIPLISVFTSVLRRTA